MHMWFSFLQLFICTFTYLINFFCTCKRFLPLYVFIHIQMSLFAQLGKAPFTALVARLLSSFDKTISGLTSCSCLGSNISCSFFCRFSCLALYLLDDQVTHSCTSSSCTSSSCTSVGQSYIQETFRQILYVTNYPCKYIPVHLIL